MSYSSFTLSASDQLEVLGIAGKPDNNYWNLVKSTLELKGIKYEMKGFLPDK
jgi:hypothetical protein